MMIEIRKCLSQILIFFFLLFTSDLCSFAQTKNEVAVGYPETYEKLPKLSFTTSSFREYDQCTTMVYMVKPKLRASKTHYVIPTKGKQFNFRKYKDYDGSDGFRGYEFLGFYPQLKMFAVTESSTAEHLGFSSLVLIDSLTSYKYHLVSIGDGAVEAPIPSVQGKYLVYFYNWPYEDNSCFIGLLKVNQRSKPDKMLAEKASCDTKKWAVESIKWLDDETFYVKVFTVKAHQRQGSKFYQYLKGKIE
ncbi:hypothetical protein [Pedobacter nyackensis]|uniref:hypothetical protein n=1 Tax=Pedobacter nyackensis TaxID=475255 RepID=UPI00292E587E|nr:hypothetical protein [Pedobacter nyackensis]